MTGIDAVIADVSEVGGYFHLYAGPAADMAEWRPLRALFADRAGFAERVEVAVDRLGTEDRRAAASILQLGLASRLWSPVLGAVILHGVLPAWNQDALYWKATPGGQLPLRLPEPGGRPVVDPVADIAGVTLELLAALGDLVLGVEKLASGLLWGNAASALAGAVRAIARDRPEHAAEAIAVGRALSEAGPLRSTGYWADAVYTRRSCCLYYRVPGAGMCGDCGLRRR